MHDQFSIISWVLQLATDIRSFGKMTQQEMKYVFLVSSCLCFSRTIEGPTPSKYSVYIYIFNYSIIDLQCCVHFCCAVKWISYTDTALLSRLDFPTLSHLPRSSQNTELSSLGDTAGSHLLSVLHMMVYICLSPSPSLSHSPLPSLCPYIRSLCLHLYSCPTSRFICTIFLGFT